MGNLQYLTQQDLEEGKKFFFFFSGLTEMEKMQVMIYIHALSDRSQIVKGGEWDKEVKAG